MLKRIFFLAVLFFAFDDAGAASLHVPHKLGPVHLSLVKVSRSVRNELTALPAKIERRVRLKSHP